MGRSGGAAAVVETTVNSPRWIATVAADWHLSIHCRLPIDGVLDFSVVVLTLRRKYASTDACSALCVRTSATMCSFVLGGRDSVSQGVVTLTERSSLSISPKQKSKTRFLVPHIIGHGNGTNLRMCVDQPSCEELSRHRVSRSAIETLSGGHASADACQHFP